MNRIEAIIFHERTADDLIAKSEEHRWEAARLTAEELESGKSQGQLAREIRKSKKHVWRMKEVWIHWGDAYKRHEIDGRSFSSLENEIGGLTRHAEVASKKNDDDDEIIDGELVDDNEYLEGAIIDISTGKPTTGDIVAARIRQQKDEIPLAEQAWRELCRINKRMLNLREFMRENKIHLDGPMSAVEKEVFTRLIHDIQEEW
jgi:hypothetical protein